MGLIDVRNVDEVDQNIDDEVFEDSDYDEITSVSSAISKYTTSSDGDAEKSSTLIRCDDGAELCRVRLRGLLGAGGFGRVYDGQLEGAGWLRGRRVAVKVPRSRVISGGGETLADSFLAESALVHLRHPNIVSVLAVGWTGGQLDDGGESTDDRCDGVDVIPAVVMEFAGHRNLQSIIDDHSQTLSLRRRLNYAYDITSALSYIHRRRLVHLDVKPANIIVTDLDRCKLTDFGCSQRLPSFDDDDDAVSSVKRSAVRRPDSSPRRTASPTFNGTFAYRAPELLRGGVVSTAADVYSVGVTLWQMRSRASPYAGRDLHAIIFAVVAYHDRPDTSPTLRRRRSSVRRRPSSAVIGSARTPDRRYRNVFHACWDTNRDGRPSAAELARLFQTWRTELDSISSTSSVDTDDMDDI